METSDHFKNGANPKSLTSRKGKLKLSKMEDQTLYLSKDKEQLLDDKGKVVAVKKEKDGKVFYSEIGDETRGKGKICIGWKSKKICAEWNEHHVCIGWDEVEFCVEWEFES